MAMDTSWAAEVRWRDRGISDAANSWRARSESRSEAGWLSASILHDLRNPVGTIYAGAEILMTLDTAPIQVKRLAANMHRAAGRMRELLIDLASATYGNRSTPEISAKSLLQRRRPRRQLSIIKEFRFCLMCQDR
jgi:signal transduction histidine kinase